MCKAVGGACWGLLAALVVAAMAAVLVRLGRLPWVGAPVGAITVLVAATLAPAVCLWVRQHRLANARLLDRCARTKDLFSSAVALAETDDQGALVRAVLTQAGARSGGIAVRRVLPVRFPVRRSAYLLAICVLLAAMLFPLPGRPRGGLDAIREQAFVPLELGREDEALRAQARRTLEELTAEKASPDERRLAEKLERVWKRLDAAEISREELIENVARLADEDVMTSDEELSKVLEELRRMADDLMSGQTLDEAARSLAQGETDPMEEALKHAAGRAGGGSMSEDERGDLSKALDRRSDKAEGARTQSLAQAMTRASDSLERNDMPSAAQSLTDASNELQKVQERLDELRRLSRVMKHLNEMKRLAMSSGRARGRRGGGRQQTARAGRQQGAGRSGATGARITPETLQARQGKGQRRAGPGGVEETDRPAGEDGAGTASAGNRLADDGAGAHDAAYTARVRGELSAEGDMGTVVLESARFAGKPSAAYRQAHRSARDLLESALTDDRIPVGQEVIVRKYFELIAPQDDKEG